jgi:hypothetical protein
MPRLRRWLQPVSGVDDVAAYLGALFATLVFLVPAAALADPPARVGRLAYLEDRVGFAFGRDEALQPAMANWPISSGAVVQTGERVAGRKSGSTRPPCVWRTIAGWNLPGSTISRWCLNLAAGRLAVSIMEANRRPISILRVPGADLRFLAAGRYRLEVDGGRSELTTFAGLVGIEHAQGRVQLAAGNKAVLLDDGSLRVVGAERADAFDRWVAERESLTLASQTRRHVSPYMTGYQDLDAYGDWQAHGEYGSVWYPRTVAADWAPYRFGRWAWVAPWGWTWIDAAPWGFAPFHYGRWLQIHGRWAWIPGRRMERPVYAPALVAWIGNPGWSVSFSFGAAPAVGWFPLAPREVYVPHYRYSPTYIRASTSPMCTTSRSSNGPRGSVSIERFIHRDSPQAVTVVAASQMREGRAISASANSSRVEHRELGRAPLAVASPSGNGWRRRPRPAGRGAKSVPGRSLGGGRAPDAEPDASSARPAERETAPSRRPVQDERVPEAPFHPFRSRVREPREDRRPFARVAPDVRSPAVLPQPVPSVPSRQSNASRGVTRARIIAAVGSREGG